MIWDILDSSCNSREVIVTGSLSVTLELPPQRLLAISQRSHAAFMESERRFPDLWIE